MIGAALSKFGKDNGLKVAEGVAYGLLRGYAVTLSEGSGFKQMIVATRFPSEDAKAAFGGEMTRVDIAKEYRVRSYSVAENGINVIFNDTVGTMDKLSAFCDFLFPLLDQNDAQAGNVCNECGMQLLDGGVWLLRDGVAAFHVHESCATRIQEASAAAQQRRRDNETGSYATGLIGALLGGLLGAVVWALGILAGFISALVGLLSGFLSEKGYTLLKGKQGPGKVAILAIVVILSVLVGTAGGYCLMIIQQIGEYGQDMGWFTYYVETLLADSEFIAAAGRDVLLGLLFAALGVYAMLYREGKKVAGDKFKILK